MLKIRLFKIKSCSKNIDLSKALKTVARSFSASYAECGKRRPKIPQDTVTARNKRHFHDCSRKMSLQIGIESIELVCNLIHDTHTMFNIYVTLQNALKLYEWHNAR